MGLSNKYDAYRNKNYCHLERSKAYWMSKRRPTEHDEEPAAARMPLPERVTSTVVFKIGDPSHARKKAGKATFLLQTEVSYEVAVSVVGLEVHKIQDQYNSEIARSSAKTKPKAKLVSPSPMTIFFKPNATTTLKQLVKLDHDNYRGVLAEAWRNSQIKKRGDYQFEFLVHATEDLGFATASRQRSSQARIQAASSAVRCHDMQYDISIQFGNMRFPY